jgi:hypothetical protein
LEQIQKHEQCDQCDFCHETFSPDNPKTYHHHHQSGIVQFQYAL